MLFADSTGAFRLLGLGNKLVCFHFHAEKGGVSGSASYFLGGHEIHFSYVYYSKYITVGK